MLGASPRALPCFDRIPFIRNHQYFRHVQQGQLGRVLSTRSYRSSLPTWARGRRPHRQLGDIRGWKDEDFIGVRPTPDAVRKIGICEPTKSRLATATIRTSASSSWPLNATEKSTNIIFTKAIHLKDTQPNSYPITKTGYFCVPDWRSSPRSTMKPSSSSRNRVRRAPATQILSSFLRRHHNSLCSGLGVRQPSP